MDELELLRRARPAVDPPAHEVRTGQRRALLAGAAPVRRRRRWVGPVAVAGLVVAVVIGLGPRGTPLPEGPLAPASAEAVVDAVEVDDGWRSVSWTCRRPERISAQIRELGFDVAVQFLPVSPSLEWQVVATAGDVEFVPPARPGDLAAIRLPAEPQHPAELVVGRPAGPDEEYVSSPALGAEAPGEVLHCSRIYGMRVPDALDVLGERGLSARWRNDEGAYLPVDEVLDWYVSNSAPWALGEVHLWVGPEPPEPQERWLSADALATLTDDCPAGAGR